MAWRVREAGNEIEERHVTEVRPGGHLRQDVPAGPEIVTLCGSMRFLSLMLLVAADETARGAIVLAPFTVVASQDQRGEFKAMLDRLHRHKIAMADRVVVVTDQTGYYGASTRSEIAYAETLGCPVEIRAVAAPEVWA
jgi:hypothetical protein